MIAARRKLLRAAGLGLAGLLAQRAGAPAPRCEEAAEGPDCLAGAKLAAKPVPGLDLPALGRALCAGRCLLQAEEALEPGVLRAENCFGETALFALGDARSLERLQRFLRPPTPAGQARFEAAVRRLQADETLLFAYLPEPDAQAPVPQQPDLRERLLHPTELYPEAEGAFRRLAAASDRSVQCLVVRDERLGAQLGLGRGNFGEVFAVSREDLLRGRLANDTRFGERVAWGRVATFAELHRCAPAELLARAQSRVFALDSPFDLQRYRERGADRDCLVLQARSSPETLALLQGLDKRLDPALDLLFTGDRLLLEQGLGVVPDNYLATCRLLRRPLAPGPAPVRLLRFERGAWTDATDLAPDRREHVRLEADLDAVLFAASHPARVAAQPESSAYPLRHSRPIDSSLLAALRSADRFSVVKFYRQDCLACERIHGLFEQLALALQDAPRLAKLRLRRPENLRGVQACSFDLSLDTDADFEVHKAPLILLLGRGKLQAVDLFSEKLDLEDLDRAVYKLLRLLDDL